MKTFFDYIESSGKLDNGKITKREKIYQGMNGKYVERFYIEDGQSYIFKPLTNTEQLGKEIWAQERILLNLPLFYPKILAHSTSNDPEKSWIILEDMGPLLHVFEKNILAEVVQLMVQWHSFPVGELAEIPVKGPKPGIEYISKAVMKKKEEILDLMKGYYISADLLHKFFTKLEETVFNDEMVLSHGDLHLGNYAKTKTSIVVLDWEHVHLNYRHWDLYHLIDMSHPVFPKNTSSELREDILNMYCKLANQQGAAIEQESFFKEYFVFSSVFSIWMILLISSDLLMENSKWPKNQLHSQLNESLSSLAQCLNKI
ncbi:phosphotransferase [Bacillus sp. MUM 13]|uniref:phosphotransferase n=1 Tax=Bacillus sp. MUM 13 TaxID=1678001 RepID=UPI0008F5D3A1|nr:phosphotransferase [Bacillus sp. MUM 13]OIK09657.1 hypothetical protein BIV59_16525 [Bacillus sp. MUM 13]